MTGLPHGRSLADFEPLTSAEARLREACRNGTAARLAAAVPDVATDDNRVRAEVLRFFALGGDVQAPVHEMGVQVEGAYIDGAIYLGGAVLPHSLTVLSSRLAGPMHLNGAEVRGSLSLGGSALDELTAEHAVVRGSIFLRDGFQATGEVSLLGVRVDGDLDCRGGQFEVEDGDALSADGAVIKGAVFFNGDFRATGQVRLRGAQIGTHLYCRGGQFEVQEGCALSADGAVIKGNVALDKGFTAAGPVWLPGARIGGNLACAGGQFSAEDGAALLADGAVVQGTFFFRGLKAPVAGVSLAGAYVQRLVDDEASWGERLILDGFRYDALAGGAPTTATDRLRWLDKQLPAHAGLDGVGEDFRPQPWRQVESVLHAMGHAEEARQVAIAREERLRQADRIGSSPKTWSRLRATPYRLAARAFHKGFGLLVAYGYRPVRLLGWFVLTWLACGAAYWFVALPPLGVFAPSDPLVFQNPAYRDCMPAAESGSSGATRAERSRAQAPVRQAGNWYLCERVPEEYAGFSPLAYSLDVILPLVDLGQEKSWGPMIPTPKADAVEELFTLSWKHGTRWLIWLETLFGWVASLLLVAIVSGLAKRRDD